ncbi:MAG TPA: glycosyltransferase [Burkholderiales bacterium]|nr:glycosyltransferase [Burkholderiales bacterium]
MPDLSVAVPALQWIFLGYFIGVNGGYLLLDFLCLAPIRRHLETRAHDMLPRPVSGYEPPVSIVVPAYNEQAAIVDSVRALLQLEYPDYEVIVVNDGSRDGTLAMLQQEFELALFPEAYWRRLRVQIVHGIYRSAAHPRLRVIDKVRGGKADALNAGINAARYPLFCAVDAGSILQRDSLQRAVQPFLDDPRTIVSGGAVRIANGCAVTDGFLTAVALPRSPLALVQIVEYLRAFLFGQLGWSPLNAVLIVSGAFGVFRKEAVVTAGGYRADAAAEDTELVLRLHRLNRAAGTPYRIAFVPEPVCWRQAPESLRALKSQRMRRQRGLAEALSENLGLLFHPRGGAPAWLALPFMTLFEWGGPALEVLGYAFMSAAWALGLISLQAFVAFMVVAVGFGILLSVGALLLEEISFHVYRRRGQITRLLFAVLVENFGYRQLVAVWRLGGLLRWLFGGKITAGERKRPAQSQARSSPPPSNRKKQ